MITGIATTDINNHHVIELTQNMKSPLTSSFWFLRGICEDTNVVTDYDTWRRLCKFEEIPTNVPVFINIDPQLILKKFPFTPVTIIGTQLVERNLKVVDRLIHVQYRELANTITPDKFPFPNMKPNKLAVLPHFDLYEYVINDNEYIVDLSLPAPRDTASQGHQAV